MEQNRELRNKPTLLWSIHLLPKKARIYNGEKTASSIHSFGKTGHYMQKNQTGLLFYTIRTHTKPSNWIKDLNVRRETIKLLEENIGIALFDMGLRNIFWICPSGKGNKSKNKQMGLYQLKMFAQQSKLSTKWKSRLLNRRRYLQITI